MSFQNHTQNEENTKLRGYKRIRTLYASHLHQGSTLNLLIHALPPPPHHGPHLPLLRRSPHTDPPLPTTRNAVIGPTSPIALSIQRFRGTRHTAPTPALIRIFAASIRVPSFGTGGGADVGRVGCGGVGLVREQPGCGVDVAA